MSECTRGGTGVTARSDRDSARFPGGSSLYVARQRVGNAWTGDVARPTHQRSQTTNGAHTVAGLPAQFLVRQVVRLLSGGHADNFVYIHKTLERLNTAAPCHGAGASHRLSTEA
jgi:hypothetical protein